MKKKGLAFYLNGIAFVLGIAGVILTVYSSNVTADNNLQNLPLLIAGGVAALVLVLVAMIVPGIKGVNHDPITAVSVLAAIALYSYVFGQCILQRVMLIAGLFSFNSGNTAGWQVFYITIAAVACLFVGAIFMVIGSFCKSVKTVEIAE